MEPIIYLLFTVIILGVVFYLVWWLLAQIPMPPPFRVVANVVLAVLAVLVLLGVLFGGITVPVLRPLR